MSRVLYRADRLVDGTGAAPLAGAALLTEADRIVAVGRAADLGSPDGAAIVDLPAGTTIIPGLIDSHVHLAYSGSPDKVALRAERLAISYAAMALRAAAYAQSSLVHGFTALRDMHAPGTSILDLRDAIDAGQIVGPRIKACGRGLTVTGGHMDLKIHAEHVATDPGFSHPCEGPVGFRAGVRAELKAGADFIKLNTCVSSSKVPGVWWRPEMTPDEIRAACDEAHAQGVKVAAHTSGGPPLDATIENGVDIVEHAHWIDDATIDLMLARGTYLVPTLTVNERNFEVPLDYMGGKLSPWTLASRPAKWDSLARALKAGVKIGAGTDAGFMLPHGTMHWRELAFLVQGGMTPLQAIAAATSVNADILDLNAGRLAPGRLADLVFVAGDPTADIGLLADAARLTVVKGGVRVAEAGRLVAHTPPPTE